MAFRATPTASASASPGAAPTLHTHPRLPTLELLPTDLLSPLGHVAFEPRGQGSPGRRSERSLSPGGGGVGGLLSGGGGGGGGSPTQSARSRSGGSPARGSPTGGLVEDPRSPHQRDHAGGTAIATATAYRTAPQGMAALPLGGSLAPATATASPASSPAQPASAAGGGGAVNMREWDAEGRVAASTATPRSSPRSERRRRLIETYGAPGFGTATTTTTTRRSPSGSPRSPSPEGHGRGHGGSGLRWRSPVAGAGAAGGGVSSTAPPATPTTSTRGALAASRATTLASIPLGDYSLLSAGGGRVGPPSPGSGSPGRRGFTPSPPRDAGLRALASLSTSATGPATTTATSPRHNRFVPPASVPAILERPRYVRHTAPKLPGDMSLMVADDEGGLSVGDGARGALAVTAPPETLGGRGPLMEDLSTTQLSVTQPQLDVAAGGDPARVATAARVPVGTGPGDPSPARSERSDHQHQGFHEAKGNIRTALDHVASRRGRPTGPQEPTTAVATAAIRPSRDRAPPAAAASEASTPPTRKWLSSAVPMPAMQQPTTTAAAAPPAIRATAARPGQYQQQHQRRAQYAAATAAATTTGHAASPRSPASPSQQRGRNAAARSPQQHHPRRSCPPPQARATARPGAVVAAAAARGRRGGRRATSTSQRGRQAISPPRLTAETPEVNAAAATSPVASPPPQARTAGRLSPNNTAATATRSLSPVPAVAPPVPHPAVSPLSRAPQGRGHAHAGFHLAEPPSTPPRHAADPAPATVGRAAHTASPHTMSPAQRGVVAAAASVPRTPPAVTVTAAADSPPVVAAAAAAATSPATPRGRVRVPYVTLPSPGVGGGQRVWPSAPTPGLGSPGQNAAVAATATATGRYIQHGVLVSPRGMVVSDAGVYSALIGTPPRRAPEQLATGFPGAGVPVPMHPPAAAVAAAAAAGYHAVAQPHGTSSLSPPPAPPPAAAVGVAATPATPPPRRAGSASPVKDTRVWSPPATTLATAVGAAATAARAVSPPYPRASVGEGVPSPAPAQGRTPRTLSPDKLYTRGALSRSPSPAAASPRGGASPSPRAMSRSWCGTAAGFPYLKRGTGTGGGQCVYSATQQQQQQHYHRQRSASVSVARGRTLERAGGERGAHSAPAPGARSTTPPTSTPRISRPTPRTPSLSPKLYVTHDDSGSRRRDSRSRSSVPGLHLHHSVADGGRLWIASASPGDPAGLGAYGVDFAAAEAAAAVAAAAVGAARTSHHPLVDAGAHTGADWVPPARVHNDLNATNPLQIPTRLVPPPTLPPSSTRNAGVAATAWATTTAAEASHAVAQAVCYEEVGSQSRYRVPASPQAPQPASAGGGGKRAAARQRREVSPDARDERTHAQAHDADVPAEAASPRPRQSRELSPRYPRSAVDEALARLGAEVTLPDAAPAPAAATAQQQVEEHQEQAVAAAHPPAGVPAPIPRADWQQSLDEKGQMLCDWEQALLEKRELIHERERTLKMREEALAREAAEATRRLEDREAHVAAQEKALEAMWREMEQARELVQRNAAARIQALESQEAAFERAAARREEDLRRREMDVAQREARVVTAELAQAAQSQKHMPQGKPGARAWRS